MIARLSYRGHQTESPGRNSGHRRVFDSSRTEGASSARANVSPNQARGSLGARRDRIAFANLRTIVQRTTPSFTVEVQRTSRRGTGQTAQTWLAESKPQISESTRLSLLVADAPFRTAPAEEPSQEIAPPHRVGRILPSLIDEDAANWALRDSSASEQEAPSPSPRRQGKPRGDGITAALPQRNSWPATEADALGTDNGAKAPASDDDPSSNQTVAQLHPQPNETRPTVRMKEASRKTGSIDSEHNQVVPSASGQTTMAEMNAKATTLSNIQDGPTPVRKRLIIGRYVVGDEFKPGERWKHLLHRKR